MIRQIRHLPAALIAALVLWAPLAYAGVTPRAQLSLQLLAFLALAVAGLAAGSVGWMHRVRIPLAALVGIAGLGLMQAASWPPGSAATLSPEHHRIYTQSDLAVDPASDRAVRLTVAGPATRAAVLAWLGVAAAAAAAALAGRRRRHRRALLFALVSAALFQVFFGARRWLAGATTIWGVEVPGNPNRLRGTFVNSDHLALYLEMALPVVFAWIWWARLRARREPLAETRALLIAPPVLIWLSLFLGLAFTGSRAGLAAAVVGVVTQGLLVAASDRRWRSALAGMAAALLGIGVVAAVGLQQGLGRWLATSPYEVTWNARIQVYSATLELWRRFPLFGSGLGTFIDTFPMAQPARLSGTWRHAHSDVLEFLLTAGLVGAVLLTLGLWVLVVRLRRLWLGARRSENRAAALAALGALAGVAIHSGLDFGLSVPANAYTLVVLLGAAAAAEEA